MPKVGDCLRRVLFEHREIVFFQVGDQMLFVVNDRGVQHNFIDFCAENKSPGFGFRRRWRLLLGTGLWKVRLTARLCATGRWLRGG